LGGLLLHTVPSFSFQHVQMFFSHYKLRPSSYLWVQVGKHGLITEFTHPDYNVRRSATYLPEVAGHEGNIFISMIPYI
jgi:hypothetical protein